MRRNLGNQLRSSMCLHWPSRGNKSHLLSHQFWRGCIKPPCVRCERHGIYQPAFLYLLSLPNQILPHIFRLYNWLLKSVPGEASSQSPSLESGVLSETGSGGRPHMFCGCGWFVPGTDADVIPATGETVLEAGSHLCDSWKCWEMGKAQQWWPGITSYQGAKTQGTANPERKRDWVWYKWHETFGPNWHARYFLNYVLVSRLKGYQSHRKLQRASL